VAAGVDPTTISLPAGFNLAVFLNRNILTTDAVGVPSPDSRLPGMSFTMAYGVTHTQGFDPVLVGGTATITLQVMDEIGQLSSTTAPLLLQ